MLFEFLFYFFYAWSTNILYLDWIRIMVFIYFYRIAFILYSNFLKAFNNLQGLLKTLFAIKRPRFLSNWLWLLLLHLIRIQRRLRDLIHFIWYLRWHLLRDTAHLIRIDWECLWRQGIWRNGAWDIAGWIVVLIILFGGSTREI